MEAPFIKASEPICMTGRWLGHATNSPEVFISDAGVGTDGHIPSLHPF